MKLFNTLMLVACILFTAATLLLATGCAKEYSYERQPIDSVVVSNPSVPLASSCSSCKATILPDSSWRFTLDGILYCGKVAKTVTLPERTAFTFFGPSACSVDSGFVTSVYIENNILNGDKKDMRAKLACYYYDKVRPSYLFMSSSTEPLSMTISNYSFQNGTASGTFSGIVETETGEKKLIKDGQFRIHLQ